MDKLSATKSWLVPAISLSFFSTKRRHLFLCSFFLSSQMLFAQKADSVSIAIAPRYDSVGKIHRFWLGEGYRKLWAVPVNLKVFDFNREKGGISIQRTGGGLQTKSLRFTDAAGKAWVLRSLQKFPERGMPEKLRKTFLRNVLQDQVITSHPYAAITVPPFATALGIAHATPSYVFIPDDERLGVYRQEFKNSVMLMEAAAPEDSVRTDNTAQAQAKLEDDNDYTVDQKLVLRARLLDMLLGDWDRHEDQWRWEKRKSGATTTYRPVPRDRDNVYYNTTGVLPWIVSHQWLMSRLQGFRNNIRDVGGFNFNSRFFDRYFLNSLTANDWLEQASIVQQTISDSLIEAAVKLMPHPIFQLSGDKIIERLKTRRENLKETAMEYYRLLATNVDVPGTNKHELFEVDHGKDGLVNLSIYKIKKDHSREKRIYQRSFDPAATKEIRLYGMDGNDVFSSVGTEASPIKVRMIGGSGVDSFLVNAENKNERRLYVYDITTEANAYPSQNVKLRIGNDSAVNQFNKRSFQYNRSGPVVSLFVNMDYGALTTLGWISEKQGFRKEPYASHHEVIANYSAVRKSFNIRYASHWRQVIGKYDLQLTALARGPHNVSNFFGLGNQTVYLNPGKEGIEYYRNRYDVIDADFRIRREVARNFSWSAGPAVQYYRSKMTNNNGKFLSAYNSANPSQKVFGTNFFAGITAGIQLKPLQPAAITSKGFYFSADLRAMKEMSGDERSFGALSSAIHLFLPITKDSGLVLMNKLGGGITVGEPAFYQMMELGGVQNLRGFNSRRFTGKSMLYHNAELRAKLFDFESFLLPGSFGIIGFSDVGRVWMPNETSTRWHHGYGGGIYLAPADVVLLRFIVGHSVERTQFYFNFALGL